MTSTPHHLTATDTDQDRNEIGQTEDQFRAAIGPAHAARLEDDGEFELAWRNCIDAEMITENIALIDGDDA